LSVAVEEPDGTLLVTLTGEFDLAGVGLVENALRRVAHTLVPERLVLESRRARTSGGRRGLR
jgi:hypothetical protein